MSEQTQQNEKTNQSKLLLEAFTFHRCGVDVIDERCHAMGSLLHTAAQMVIRSESRKGEGFECIRHLEMAMFYYIASQQRKAFDKEEPKEEESRIIT